MIPRHAPEDESALEACHGTRKGAGGREVEKRLVVAPRVLTGPRSASPHTRLSHTRCVQDARQRGPRRFPTRGELDRHGRQLPNLSVATGELT